MPRNSNPKDLMGQSTSRPLVTLAMILDEEGFPETSKVYPGNVSEPSTLKSILDDLRLQRPKQLRLGKPTVVIDAGLATGNLQMIRCKGTGSPEN